MSTFTKFGDNLLEEHKKVDIANKGSSVDQSKRQGAEEAVDESRKLLERFEGLKHCTAQWLKEAQDLLQKVKNYESSLGNFIDWLRKEAQILNSINSFACTTEDISVELTKIKVAKLI